MPINEQPLSTQTRETCLRLGMASADSESGGLRFFFLGLISTKLHTLAAMGPERKGCSPCLSVPMATADADFKL